MSLNGQLYKDCTIYGNCKVTKSTSTSSSSVISKTCTGTDKFSSFDSTTGQFICTSDVSGGSLGNYFNQQLNTTSNPQFNNLNLTGNLTEIDTIITKDINLSGNIYTNDSGFFFNGSNHNLGIGNANPFYALDIYRNLNEDLQIRSRNAYSGKASYMMLEASSSYVSLELKKTSGQDWKFGMFGDDYFKIFDGTLSRTLFSIQNVTGNANFTGDIMSTDRSFYYNSSTKLLKASGGFNFNASSITCSGNDKISAYSNATGLFTCTTDQTSGGGSTLTVNRTIKDNYNTNATIYNTSVITIPITANYNYTINCILLVASNGTVNGVHLNITYPFDRRSANIILNHPTSATAMAYSVCRNLTQCLDASGTSVVYPSFVNVKIDGLIENGNSNGNFEIRLKSEQSVSNATVFRGSYCSLQSVS